MCLSNKAAFAQLMIHAGPVLLCHNCKSEGCRACNESVYEFLIYLLYSHKLPLAELHHMAHGTIQVERYLCLVGILHGCWYNIYKILSPSIVCVDITWKLWLLTYIWKLTFLVDEWHNHITTLEQMLCH